MVKEVERVEVIPDDYHHLKHENEELEHKIKKLEHKLKKTEEDHEGVKRHGKKHEERGKKLEEEIDALHHTIRVNYFFIFQGTRRTFITNFLRIRKTQESTCQSQGRDQSRKSRRKTIRL